MATLSLKISLDGGAVVKTMQFDPTTTVYDTCRIIREKILEANAGDPKEYGLFLTSDEDTKKGIWLEPSRSLDYYILRNGDLLEYNKKMRNLRVRMLDGTVKTLLVDDSQIVANLMVVICTKIGITNYDEYGLVREEQKEEADPCEKPNYGTLTMRRKHQDKDRDAKMDQLRKKLRTDDEVNWVESSKTLREQGVDVTETLLLRRKLFFSDRNVDSRDPVQLNLLYVQARDTILDGTHPITQDNACEFAGIQCQIQFGDHKEDKHTPGFLDLKEFLPASYMKVKGIEKKIFKEHRKHTGLSELDAKVLYTKTARALPTYGVAFFLVKEKMKGKNKLVPRLLGVTKDSVLRLDEKTKEIIQTWPLTTVRRWCASPNTFTLDFGDYSDQYYSVQTTEAEQILQVIAGYIDIILRKQRAKDHLGVGGDDGAVMLEDTVAPHRANIIQHDTIQQSGKVNTESVAKPAVLRPGEGGRPFTVVTNSTQQHTTISGQIITGHAPPNSTRIMQTKVTSVLSEPQRALLSTISTGTEIIKHTERELTRASLPALGGDAQSLKWKQVTLDTNKQVVTSHIAAMNAATAQVVTLTSGTTEEVDSTAVGAAITTITSNLPEMTKGVQMLAALMDDSASGDKLLDATRKLCSAFTDLLKAAEPETKEPRQNLLNAASRVGEASTSVLHTIGEENEDKETQDILLSLAKAVANTTAALVLKAKNVAAQCKDDQQLQNGIISAATHCALATSQLVACTKVVAPTLHNPQCREQLTNAARSVARAVEKLLEACQPVGHLSGVEELTSAARKVTEALERLLAHCDTERPQQATVKETVVETVLTATDRMAAANDTTELVSQAKALAQATARLLADIKTEAESCPSEAQRKLLAAAKLLSDATARMLEAARLSASSPQDRDKQESLRRAAEELRCITVDYAHGQDIVSSQIARLQETAKRATSSATQLITAAQNVTNYNTNTYSQETLLEECRSLSSSCTRVTNCVRPAASSVSPAAAVGLISASEALLQSAGGSCQAARSALPAVRDAAASKHLADTLHRLTADCVDLRSAVNRAQISCKGMEFEAATEIIRSLQRDMEEVEETAKGGGLTPLPGETPEWIATTLYTSHRSVSSALSRLCAGSSSAATPAADALCHFVRAATAAAAHTDEPLSVIQSTKLVLSDSLTLVETVERYTTTSEAVDMERIKHMADTVTQGMERTIQMSSSHTELDDAIDNVNETLHILDMGDFPKSDRSYGELQSLVTKAALELHRASAEVVSSVEQPAELRRAAHRCGEGFNALLGAAVEIAPSTENIETRNEMISAMKTVTITTSKLLTTAKSVSQNLSRPNAKNDLTEAARAVTEAINHLVDVCTEGAPGQKECDAAIRSIESTRPLLAGPREPVADLGYFACLDAIVDHSKGLSEGMSGMAGAARRGTAPAFCVSVRAVADSVCGLVHCAAHAAYIVAVSDPTSVAGRAGLVSSGSVSRAASAIAAACHVLTHSPGERQQVLSAATEIAKHTSSLCNACRVASSKTSEPQTKRDFVQAAKDVANSTAALVKEIKALDSNYTEENCQRCAEATGPLLAAVSSLRQLADSPEFAAVPARLSPHARREQEDILVAGRDIISGSCSMIESARALIVNPQERSEWQALATHSNTLSDSIKRLLNNIRDKAPGTRECGAALETLSKLSRELDDAAIAAVGQELPARKLHTLQGYMEQVESSATEILERLDQLKTSAKSEAESLGHSVLQTISYAEPLVQAAIGAASNITESKLQSSLLEQVRTVLETLSLLLHAARESQGNPRATSVHPTIDSQTSLSRSALEELISFSRSVSAARGETGTMLDSLARAKDMLTQHRMSLIGSYDEADSFVDYQTRMVGASKEIARLATDMTAKSATDSSLLVQLGNEMCEKYSQLARDSMGASATTPNADIANRIRTAVVELGDEVSELIKAGGHCRVAANADTRKDVANASRRVNEKVLSVLSALQAGSRGTQACIDAAATIAAIIGDLETTTLFASAGTLHSDKEGDTFSNHRENILKTAKTLVEDTKSLVGGAAGTQDLLAEAAKNATHTIVQLCDVVKQGAMSLGSSNPDSQVLLLNAARDVAQALRDLAIATKGASGKHVSHPDMDRLKQSAKRLSDASKRWSLPAKSTTLPRQGKRRSITIGLKGDYASYDSETDAFMSDQEDELIKLLDYSSQDDDVSPSIFHDHCEEVIMYIEKYIIDPPKRYINDDLNDRYSVAAKNSLVDMDWRVLKYGENIFLGEVRKLVDLTVEAFERAENKRKRQKIIELKANSDLDKEMKRLSQVVEDLDFELPDSVVTKKPEVPVKKPRLEDKILMHRLKNPFANIKKVKPVKLQPTKLEDLVPSVIHEVNNDIVEESQVEIVEIKPEEQPEVVDDKKDFWTMFKDDTEWWKALAKRHLEKMEETRQELARFSGHELVLGEIQTEMNKCDTEKETLEKFIHEVDRSKTVNKEIQYDKKYEDMVLKLIEFAKKDFVYKGFDPLIDQLKTLSNIDVCKRRKIINIFNITEIDISKYTYEELCVLEKHYQEFIKKSSSKKHVNFDEKENVQPLKAESPSYHKNIILNVNSQNNISKNIDQITHSNQNSLRRSHTKNNVEIFDLTRTYPLEYYANNWWSIYEDVLKNREQRFGSIDNWWKFYENILNKGTTDDTELRRLRAVVEHRNTLRKRPRSRMQEQLKMLDEIRNDRFTESENVSTRDAESVMVTNVSSLLKTVKSVEDEHTRGTRALESTIEAINQEISTLLSPQPPKTTATPEELIRHTRLMTAATANAVSAGNSNDQDQLTAAANLGRKTVGDLLRTCKAAAYTAETPELREAILVSGSEAGEAYKQLACSVLDGVTGTKDAKAALPGLSRRVAVAVAGLLQHAQKLKGSDWVDPDDPTVIAESELLGAAASIDAAAKRLEALRPRTTTVQEADESLNFDEMILQAAKSIIAATSALVRAASAAQRELIDQGKVARRPTSSSDDGQWSEGLISAARLVAAAAHALVEAANALVQGAGSEERLVSSARHVAGSTAQLLVACKVKADPTSESTRRLQAAGAEVIRSTDNLVRAARDAMHNEEERSLVLNRRMVGGIAQEIDARSEVLRIEKELEEARGRLSAIRQAKYRLRGETSGDETDTDVYIGGYSSDASNTPFRVKTPNSSFANTTYSPNSTYTPHNTQNATNLSSHITQLNQSVHGTPHSPGYMKNQHFTPGQHPSSPGYQTSPSYNQTGFNQSGYTQSHGQNTSHMYSQTTKEQNQSNGSFNTTANAQTPSFSSFRPQEDGAKQNYEGFTTRIEEETETTVVVRTMQLPQIKQAHLITDDADIVTYKKERPEPPPRRISLHNYETRLYDTPRPITTEMSKTEEQRRYESSQTLKQEQRFGYDAPKLSSPLSPKFNARELKDTEYYSYSKPTTPKSPFDGVGQSFTEHQKSSEAIPGGHKQSEYTIKSESYQSYPRSDFTKIESREDIKSPFTTSTPNKFDTSVSQSYQSNQQSQSQELVKAQTPDFDRISSPYGKEVHSYGGPNYKEETTTEVKDIPNGTQKITTTKIYSSSPVNITSTSTKYEPIKLDGIDELSKSFDSESKYSTMDSRYNTLDSKLSSDTSRSFMRPSDFQSDYQATSSVAKAKKPSEMAKELDSMDRKFSKQTITSERIEKKSVMTSSHKSETSSTVTKKFGNF